MLFDCYVMFVGVSSSLCVDRFVGVVDCCVLFVAFRLLYVFVVCTWMLLLFVARCLLFVFFCFLSFLVRCSLLLLVAC